MSTTFLTREHILTVQDIPTEVVSVPEWGGDVLVYGLSGAERDQLEASIVEIKGKNAKTNMQNIRAKLAALSIRDEQGKRLFTDADLNALGKKSASALERIFAVAQRLSGLTDKDVEELEKNLDGAQSDASGSN